MGIEFVRSDAFFEEFCDPLYESVRKKHPDLKEVDIINFWRGGDLLAQRLAKKLSGIDVKVRLHVWDLFSYTGKKSGDIQVLSTMPDLSHVAPGGLVLKVDDVKHTGGQLAFAGKELSEKRPDLTYEEVVAHWKRLQDLTGIRPHHLIRETEEWVNYAHELIDLTLAQILEGKGELVHAIVKGDVLPDLATIRYASYGQMLADGYMLARHAENDKFQPTSLLTMWPEGALAGIAVGEFLTYMREPKEPLTPLRPVAVQEHAMRDIDASGLRDKILIVDDASRGRAQQLASWLREQSSDLDVRVAEMYHHTRMRPEYSTCHVNKRDGYPMPHLGHRNPVVSATPPSRL